MDSKEIRVLRAQRTKLLNKHCTTKEEFVDVQNKLNSLDFSIMILENENYISM